MRHSCDNAVIDQHVDDRIGHEHNDEWLRPWAGGVHWPLGLRLRLLDDSDAAVTWHDQRRRSAGLPSVNYTFMLLINSRI